MGPAVDIARRFFRVIEHDDGTWVCRDGRSNMDHHDSQHDAVEHLAQIAKEHRPSRVYVHHLDGAVVAALTLDC